MQGLTVTIRRCGSSTAAAVIGWRGRYTSNSGHEGEQSARPFRANRVILHCRKTASLFAVELP
jgi:hypothetical protein